MKFSLATAFMTLTAASAVVFATSAQEDDSVGSITLGGFKIEGFVGRKPLVGKLDEEFRVPVTVRNADYHIDNLSDLNGRFKGRIEGGHLWITYDNKEAAITGEIDEWIKYDFEGETKLL